MSWGRPFPSAGLSTQPQQRPTMSIVSICFSWRTLLSDLGSETGLTAASLQISINQSRSVCTFFSESHCYYSLFHIFCIFRISPIYICLFPHIFHVLLEPFFYFQTFFPCNPFGAFSCTLCHFQLFPAILGTIWSPLVYSHFDSPKWPHMIYHLGVLDMTKNVPVSKKIAHILARVFFFRAYIWFSAFPPLCFSNNIRIHIHE